MRDKDCNLMLNRCCEIISHIVLPWQTSPLLCMRCAFVVSFVCKCVRACMLSFVGVIYIYSCLSVSSVCLFLHAVCVHISQSQCVCLCVRPSVLCRVWSWLPGLCLPLSVLGSRRQTCTRTPSQMYRPLSPSFISGAHMPLVTWKKGDCFEIFLVSLSQPLRSFTLQT